MEAIDAPEREIPEEQEITLETAKVDQIPDTSEADSEKKEEDVVDILQPKSEPKEWVLGQGELERRYIQRELSFIAKMQWFSLVGEVLDKAMSGDNSLTVNNLLSAPQMAPGQVSMADFRDADTFIHAVGKLLTYAPDFLQKSYCIWLNVPDYERPLVMEVMALPKEDGGLSDDDGLEMIERFIDQNYEALDRFFRDKLGQLQKRVQQRMEARQG